MENRVDTSKSVSKSRNEAGKKDVQLGSSADIIAQHRTGSTPLSCESESSTVFKPYSNFNFTQPRTENPILAENARSTLDLMNLSAYQDNEEGYRYQHQSSAHSHCPINDSHGSYCMQESNAGDRITDSRLISTTVGQLRECIKRAFAPYHLALKAAAGCSKLDRKYTESKQNGRSRECSSSTSSSEEDSDCGMKSDRSKSRSRDGSQHENPNKKRTNSKRSSTSSSFVSKSASPKRKKEQRGRPSKAGKGKGNQQPAKKTKAAPTRSSQRKKK